jgi:hypothetical protein
MKVSAFTRPERVALIIAAAYAAAHLPSFAPSLEDIDSINFALGLRDFAPGLHQPHPPGYPVYIALAHLVYTPVTLLAPAMPRATAEALSLGLWSVIGGAIAIVAAARIFASLGARSWTAAWATALLAAAPLFWIQGLRPMSDMPGLAMALVAQALALQGRTDRPRLIQAGVIAGLAAGMRVQTLLLTMPLFAIALFAQRRAGAWLARPVAAFIAACLAWAVPLVLASGGIDGYLRALGTQAGEDVAFVDMLLLDPTPRRLAFVLYETFVLPWSSLPLAAVIAVAAGIGGLVMLVRERRALALLAAAFVPYTVAHMLVQETVMVRYALPALPLVAYLAARGISLAGRFAPFVAVPVLAAALIVVVPVGVAYGREPHPAFRAIADAARRAATDPPAAVYTHFGLWRALQADTGALPVVQPRWQYEWLGAVEFWKNGGTGAIWFFGDPRRNDLALIDPRSRADVVRYRWDVGDRPELNGSRPVGADWYRISPPGWFAGEGWSLTPETGGLVRATASGPDHRPIEAWVRRRPGPLHLVIGGRHLGTRGDPAAQFELAVDGVVRDSWPLTIDQTNFLRFLDLPEGIGGGDGDYARVTVGARTIDGGARRAEVAVRQFDIQDAATLVYGFGEGWHEAESDPATGRNWRWTSERSVLRVKGPPQAVALAIQGESPLRYFDTPPTVRVTAGGRVVGEFQPSADFAWSVTVPADDIARAGGAIAIECSPVYLPGAAEGTADERRLGLRLYDIRVTPVSP